MTSRHSPWGLLFWIAVGCTVLRIVFPDDLDYIGWCVVYAFLLIFVRAIVEVKHEDED